MIYDSDISEPFSITCPRCGHRFEPAVRPTFYFAKCPDCSEPIRVPASAELEQSDSEPAPEFGTSDDTYRLARPPGWEESPEEEIYFSPYPQEPQTRRDVRPEEKESRTPHEPKTPPPDEAKSPPEFPAASTPAASRVSCLACGANFDVPPSDQPRVVLCPECLEDVHVPAAGSRPMSPPLGESAPAAEQEPVEDLPRPRLSEADEPAPVRPAWDSYLDDLPERAEKPEPTRPKKKRRKKPEAQAAAEPAKNPSRREKSDKNVFDTLAEVRQEEEVPVPEWTFITGVMDFLIRPEVAIRWLYASLGFCLVGWLCGLIWHFYTSDSWLAMPFFLLPLFWIAMMTLSYAAANSMAILLETSAGNDKVEAWPEPNFREQAVDLFYLAFLLIVAGMVCFFLGNILSVFLGPGLRISLGLLFLLYPIVLLSSLEANSPFIPLTWPILSSLKTVAWAWGAFYALSFALTLVWALPLTWWFTDGGWTTFFLMLILAPLIAGWCFLYARLLGRLAWRVSLEFPEEEDEKETPEKRTRPGKKEPSVSESSGELQAAR